MNRSDDVFLLIKSLSSSEKRAFKITASRHVIGTKNKYEDLFDLYDELPDAEGYDETLFKKKLVQKGIGKHLAADRQYLKDLVLLSLRSTKSERSVTDNICEFLEYDEIFRNKRLNSMRRKNIQKAKDYCLTYNRFQEVLIFLERDYQLSMEMNQDELQSMVAKIEEERKNIYALLQDLQSLTAYHRVLFQHMRVNGQYIRKEQATVIAKLEADPLFMQFKPGRAFSLDLAYYRIMQFYALHQSDNEAYYDYHKKVVELYEAFPHMIETNRIDFKIAVYNTVNAAFRLLRLEDFPALLDKAKAIPAKDLNEEGEDWQNINFYEMLHKMNTGKSLEVSDQEAFYNKGFKKYKRKVNMARLRAMMHNLMIAHFLVARWELAMDLANEIILQKTEVRQDLAFNARFLQLILLIELGATESFQHYTRNFERFCKVNNLLLEDDAAFLKLLKIYPFCTGEKERQEVLLAMYQRSDDDKVSTSAILRSGVVRPWLTPKLKASNLNKA